MDLATDIIAFLLGLVIVLLALSSAVRVFILPRAAPDNVARLVFIPMRYVFNFAAGRAHSYRGLDSVLALYAPMSVLLLLPAWLTLVLFGYTLMFWGIGADSLQAAFTLSGSSLFTLGFAMGGTLFHTVLTLTEATIGLILVALLIAYLPTIYSAFSRREVAVTLLEVRAGAPPAATKMLARMQRLEQLDHMHDFWHKWENWFAEIEESHTSLAVLVFFRSPQPDHSWVTAAGAVLDAASLASSTVDMPRDVQAEICIRAGYIALRRIGDFFGIRYNPDPSFPAQPISISREEFDAACEMLAAEGVPLKPDRDQAWQDFGGWRVNYDAVLLGLCRLTQAPSAPWSSDRA